MKMLIVEDEPEMLAFLERLFLGCAMDVRAVSSGSVAAEALESWEPDLLISDLELPGRSGEELAQAAALRPRPPGSSSSPGTPRGWSGRARSHPPRC